MPEAPRLRTQARPNTCTLVKMRRARAVRSHPRRRRRCAADLLPIVQANVDPKSQVMTVEAGQYDASGQALDTLDSLMNDP